jgi:hypothetical protein
MMAPSSGLLHKSPPENLNDNLMYWFIEGRLACGIA